MVSTISVPRIVFGHLCCRLPEDRRYGRWIASGFGEGRAQRVTEPVKAEAWADAACLAQLAEQVKE